MKNTIGKVSVALVLLLTAAQSPAAVTNILSNGSFETGMTGWTPNVSAQPGSSGACNYNVTVAPGTETLTSTPGLYTHCAGVYQI